MAQGNFLLKATLSKMKFWGSWKWPNPTGCTKSKATSYGGFTFEVL